MGSLLPFFGKPKPDFNFHNDESLHDSTTAEPKAWYSNLGGDALAVAQNLGILRTMGKEQFAKYVAGSLDLDDPLSKVISKKLVSMLWGSLLHPPSSYRGLEHRYRTADGSNNSVLYPHLGKAGLPYAKSVPAKRPLHGARPDPGDIFDLLMARKDEGVESQSGISMMLLYHASVIIHDIFRTDDYDSNCSATSAYLDLAPLYGSDVETQHTVRLMRDGLLKPDTFAEKRLLNQPPGVCIYLIMYNRFHNYVAKQLLDINEHGRFSLPPDCDGSEEARQDPKWAQAFKLRDEHVFQTARLVTCGMYINIAIHDYLRCLMGVHEIDTPWTLDPRKALPERDNVKGLDRGEGNMVSLEFNLLYRFHSPISRRDAEWSEELFTTMLHDYIDDSNSKEAQQAIRDGKKFTTKMVKDGEVPVKTFMDWMAAKKKASPSAPSADQTKPATGASAKFFPPGLDMVGARGPNNLYRFKRGADGKFDDAQLAAEMCRAMEDPICQFGAQQIPKVFKAIEIMGILQARKWEVATLNEFREFFGMSRFKTFEEMNTDKDIQDKLRYLYEDPDLVEFYPGLFCEGQGRKLDPGTPMPGGEATSLWRAVFSDAVTLVRSDRFYTLDWNVGSLTAWGMKEVTSDPKVNKGSVMHRLFQRAFPGCFEYNSVHMWQPFYTPTKNIQLAHDQGYLNFLNLSGLEDNKKNSLLFTKENQQVFYGQNKEAYGKWKKEIQKNGVRRVLQQKGDMRWRGDEYITIVKKPQEVTSYKTIREEILGGPNSKNWVNTVILEPSDIPYGSLRKIMTKQWNGWKDANDIVHQSLPDDWEDIFMDYFVGLAQDIRLREQRPLQKRDVDNGDRIVESQCYQLDIVKDLAVPVVTRFIADLIGFWHDVKTVEYPNRKLSENEIYEHIENCQNFEAYDSDPTKTWHRRQLFKESIKVLKGLSEQGVRISRRGWLEVWRNYGSERDGQYVQDLRKVGVGMTQALLRRFYDSEVVAAIMLYTALDAAQRFVLTFSEGLAWFIDPTWRNDWDVTIEDEQTRRWTEFKKLAWEDTVDSGKAKGKKTAPKNRSKKNDKEITAQLEQYVREVSRLSNVLDITRVYEPANGKKRETTDMVIQKSVNSHSPAEKQKITQGETVLLNLREAYSDPASGFVSPNEFRLRPLDGYIGFGPTVSATTPGEMVAPRFSKRATLIGLTGLIKHCAHLSRLRVAHDKGGRLKRVTTPDGSHRYASPQWDRLLAFPTTWNVRYDGIGTEVFTDGDNADQGHGQNMIWQYESLINQTDGPEEARRKQKAEDEEAINKRIDAAVKKAVAEALAGKGKETSRSDYVGMSKVGSTVTTTEISALSTP